MPRFLFASDTFKGTLSSGELAELLTQAALEFFPDAECVGLEVADGGEGTVEAVASAMGGRLRRLEVAGPRGGAVRARYALLDERRALIEMAAASGLPLLAPQERNPLLTSTYGTGQLIADALDQGVREITLAIGGSASNDGGMGCLRALGVRFLDGQGAELEGSGGDLARVCQIDRTALDARLAETSVRVMCDVDNPLLGPRGATRVFAPQKGATPEMVEELERGMENYAHVLESCVAGFDASRPGMGAAGGLGAATCALLGAELVSGIDCVLDLLDFDELLKGCDLCVTGEGHADSQSAHGKVVSGVAARCHAAGVPCVAIVGAMSPDAAELLQVGVDALVPTVIDATPLEELLAHARENYVSAARRVFSLLRLGTGL